MNTVEEKRFSEWITLKERLHSVGRIRTTHEGEVWWAAIGENVGVEINGKNESFTRPVLVFRKLSRLNFLAVPLTSQAHSGTWYVPFVFKERRQYAVLSQIRVLSVSRLNKRMGTLSKADYSLIRKGFAKLYLEESKK